MRVIARNQSKRFYGIVAYSGGRDAPAFFDGWYDGKSWDVVETAFENFKERYPHAYVHIVKCVRSEWREKDK